MEAARVVSVLRRAKIAGDIIDHEHASYDKLRRVWNAMADRCPAVIVRARNVLDVEKVVAVAAEQQALLAVRGGGHSIPGLSTCDDGIVLDLSLMNKVTIDKSAKLAYVEGGAQLGDLDHISAAAGLVVPAGVVSHTGVAGLTLGGGMGWLSRRYGLTIDSLLAAEIVTADGHSRRVSMDEEPDLFWAIRGGGGNFGVVTRFIFKMHPLSEVLVGNWIYPIADSRGVLTRFRDLAATARRELTTALHLELGALQVTAFWSGNAADAEAAVTPFGRIGAPSSGSIGGVTFLDLQKRSDDLMAWNKRFYSKGGYLSDLDEPAIEVIIGSVAHAPTLNENIYLLQLGGAIADVADEATPYTGRAAGYYWIVGSGWDNKAGDARALSWCRAAGARMAEVSMRGNYVNEQGDFGKEVAIKAYGEVKYARLAKLKARYDPGNLFRLNQNIEPKA